MRAQIQVCLLPLKNLLISIWDLDAMTSGMGDVLVEDKVRSGG